MIQKIISAETRPRDLLLLADEYPASVGIDRDYFRRYHPRPVIENGIECRDMVRLRIELD